MSVPRWSLRSPVMGWIRHPYELVMGPAAGRTHPPVDRSARGAEVHAASFKGTAAVPARAATTSRAAGQ